MKLLFLIFSKVLAGFIYIATQVLPWPAFVGIGVLLIVLICAKRAKP